MNKNKILNYLAVVLALVAISLRGIKTMTLIDYITVLVGSISIFIALHNMYIIGKSQNNGTEVLEIPVRTLEDTEEIPVITEETEEDEKELLF